MLIFTEDAHLKALRTFETDEHLRGMQAVFTLKLKKPPTK